MDSKSASIIVAVVLILIVIVLLIAYSYYPSSDYNTVTPVEAKAAQSVASKRGKDADGTFNSPPRETDSVWLAWKAKHDAALKLQAAAASNGSDGDSSSA
jgi:hypothetical protein